MFCKWLKSCFVVLIYIASVLGIRDLRVTDKQKSRIRNGYFEEDLKNETVFDKRSRYLYEIIHSRPENLDIEISDTCILRPWKSPDFAALKDPKLRVSDVKCLEYLWKIRYYEEIEIATAFCDDDDMQMENITKLHVPDEQFSVYPHMGAIGWQNSKDTWLFTCEGALISEKHVLTSATCVQSPKGLQPDVVRFGVYDISDKEEVGKSPTDVLISKINIYPDYKPGQLYYDIAVIEIAKKIDFTSMVHPACIWSDTSYIDLKNTKINTLSGWQNVESNKIVRTKKLVITSSFDVFPRIELFNKPKPGENRPGVPFNKNMMQLKDIQQLTNIDCQLILKNITNKKNNKGWHGLMYHQQCGISHEHTNQLERGTVLQTAIDIPEITSWKIHYVVGVRSVDFTFDKKRRLSVFSRVSIFLNWIEKIVWS